LRAPRHVGLNALFLDPGRSGGPETYIRGLVPALAREHPTTRFTVVTTRRGARALRADGWTDFCSLMAMASDEGQRGRRLWSEQVRLPLTARRRGWDVLHSTASVAPLWTARVPAVVTLHDVTFLQMTTFSRLTTFAMRTTVVGPARRAQALVAVSAAARDQAVAVLGLPADRFVVAPNGPGRPQAAAPVPEAAVRASQGLGPTTRVVLCVAALRPHKDQATLVASLPHLPADVELVLCGHPEGYERTVRELAIELGVEQRVRILDYVSDSLLEGLWAASACAAFPTRAEGFGLPVLEALRRGVPVACSDLRVLREVGGNVPHYFKPGDARAAARAVDAAMRDTTASVRGPVQAAGFSWEAAARTTFTAYERALAAAA